MTWGQTYQFVVEYLLSGEHPDQDLSAFSNLYLLLFLIFNIIILVNFVISVFTFEYEQGSFDELLLEQCMQCEYDERYGSIVCVTSPLDFVFLPISWTMYVVDSNEVLCKVVYMPLAVGMTMVLAMVNLVTGPLMIVMKVASILQVALE